VFHPAPFIESGQGGPPRQRPPRAGRRRPRRHRGSPDQASCKRRGEAQPPNSIGYPLHRRPGSFAPKGWVSASRSPGATSNTRFRQAGGGRHVEERGTSWAGLGDDYLTIAPFGSRRAARRAEIVNARRPSHERKARVFQGTAPRQQGRGAREGGRVSSRSLISGRWTGCGGRDGRLARARTRAHLLRCRPRLGAQRTGSTPSI